MTEEAFISFYQEHAPKLFKYCYFRVHSKEDAEDLAGKVFMKTWDYLVAGNTIDSIRAFLYRSAHNLIVDFYKTSKHSREVPLHDTEGKPIDIPDDASFVKDLETRELVTEVQEKLKDLPDQYREIIVLRYINDLSIGEIAKVTDMSENNVSVKLHRAINQLRRLAGSESRPKRRESLYV